MLKKEKWNFIKSNGFLTKTRLYLMSTKFYYLAYTYYILNLFFKSAFLRWNRSKKFWSSANLNLLFSLKFENEWKSQCVQKENKRSKKWWKLSYRYFLQFIFHIFFLFFNFLKNPNIQQLCTKNKLLLCFQYDFNNLNKGSKAGVMTLKNILFPSSTYKFIEMYSELPKI